MYQTSRYHIADHSNHRPEQDFCHGTRLWFSYTRRRVAAVCLLGGAVSISDDAVSNGGLNHE
jgi:hypothetical protein